MTARRANVPPLDARVWWSGTPVFIVHDPLARGGFWKGISARETMRFSQRTNWNTEESELAKAHRRRVQAGLPIADLTASNPTRCGFHYDPGILAALEDERALDYDPQPRGLPAAREAVCAYYAGHGVAVAPEQVVLTTSTSEAYSFLVSAALRSRGRDPGAAAGISAFRLPGRAGRCAAEGCAAGLRLRVADRSGGISAGHHALQRGPSCWCIPTTRPGTLPSRGRPKNWRGCAGSSGLR